MCFCPESGMKSQNIGSSLCRKVSCLTLLRNIDRHREEFPVMEDRGVELWKPPVPKKSDTLPFVDVNIFSAQ